MFNWLRELYEIRREKSICNTCAVLQQELDRERREKQALLDHILNPRVPEVTTAQNDTPVPILTPKRPWRAVQADLERQDRLKQQEIMRQFEDRVPVKPGDSKEIEKLEEKLGIKDA